MNEFLIAAFGLIAAIGVAIRGPAWGFRWVYLPTVIFVPYRAMIALQGFPDLTGQRSVLLGIVIGAILSNRVRQLLPRWRAFDLFAVAAVLSFSVSVARQTTVRGFYTELVSLTLDWACPYLLARAALCDTRALRKALLPFVICSAGLGVLVVYEARMADRTIIDFWNFLGLKVERPEFAGSWRWGYLRAFGSFQHSILLGTFFTIAVPLVALWGMLERRIGWSAFAVVACVAGCAAAMSRGPLLVLAAVSTLFTMIAFRMRLTLVLISFAIVVITPALFSIGSETVSETREDLENSGNTESDRYRVALLMIYATDIAEVGWWGDPSIVGREYTAATSIDNAYLYLFIIGGWMGGSLFCCMVLRLLYLGIRAVWLARGRRRKILAAGVAGFAGVAGCMIDVWFAPDYASFFWITAAVVLNLTDLVKRSSSNSARTLSSTRRVSNPSLLDHRKEDSRERVSYGRKDVRPPLVRAPSI